MQKKLEFCVNLTKNDFYNAKDIIIEPKKAKNAEIRLDINRLYIPTNKDKNDKKRKRKRKRIEFDNQELKDEIERKMGNNNDSNNIVDMRAKIRLNLCKILRKYMGNMNSNKKRKISDNMDSIRLNGSNDIMNNDEIEMYCKCIEQKIYDGSVDKGKRFNRNKYVTSFRDIYFNLKNNDELMKKVLSKNMDFNELIKMKYKDLANNDIKKKRNEIKIKNDQWFDRLMKNNDYNKINWIQTNDFECSVCGSNKCEYEQRKIYQQNSKSDIWTSKNVNEYQNTNVCCKNCGYTFTKLIHVQSI